MEAGRGGGGMEEGERGKKGGEDGGGGERGKKGGERGRNCLFKNVCI